VHTAYAGGKMAIFSMFFYPYAHINTAEVDQRIQMQKRF